MAQTAMEIIMTAKSETWPDRLVLFSLCGLVFTLPFSKSMVEIFFIFALIFWVLSRIMRYRRGADLIAVFKPRGTELNLPIYIFMFTALLSTIGSASFVLSVKGLFCKSAEWAMLYFIVAEAADSEEKFNTILIAILLSMALVGVDGLFQCITGVDFLRGYSSGGRGVAQGPFSSRNGFAGWLVIMIPLALSLIYLKKNNFSGHSRNYKTLAWLLTGILALCMVLTYSRGALAAVQLSVILFAVFNRRKTLLIVMIFLLIASLAFSNHVRLRTNPMVMIQGFDRIGLWQEALRIIEDFPLTGCGLNTYAAIGPFYKVASGGGGCYPHNSYLQMAAELGLLGLGAFFWIIVRLFRTSLACIDKVRDKPYGVISLGLIAGLFGFFVQSFVDVNIYSLQLGNLMWFMMALCISAHRIALSGKGKIC